MKDESLAAIFYIIVHDFSDRIVTEACAQIRHDNSDGYVKAVQSIREWAQKNDYSVLGDHAKQLLKRIDELKEEHERAPTKTKAYFADECYTQKRKEGLIGNDLLDCINCSSEKCNI